jgi:hypothetical protein
MFHMIRRINSDYFLKQLQLGGLCNADTMFCVRSELNCYTECSERSVPDFRVLLSHFEQKKMLYQHMGICHPLRSYEHHYLRDAVRYCTVSVLIYSLHA